MTKPTTPKKWRVLVTVDASMFVDVTAADEGEAKTKALQIAYVPCLCHQCSDDFEIGEALEALEATEIDDE